MILIEIYCDPCNYCPFSFVCLELSIVTLLLNLSRYTWNQENSINYGGRLVQVGFLEFRSHLPCGIVTGCDSVRHSLIRDPGDPLRLLLFVPRFIIHPYTCAGVLLSSLSWELTKFWSL